MTADAVCIGYIHRNCNGLIYGTCIFKQLSKKTKSVIDRDGATCRNNNHFERPTILNAP